MWENKQAENETLSYEACHSSLGVSIASPRQAFKETTKEVCTSPDSFRFHTGIEGPVKHTLIWPISTEEEKVVPPL